MNLCDSPTYTYWHVGIKCMFPIFQQHSRLSQLGWCYKRTTTCIRLPKITRKKKQKQIKHMHCLLTYIILDLAQFVSISVSPWRRVDLPQPLYFHAVSAVACFAWLHEAYPTWWTAGRTETTAVKWPTRIITNNLQQPSQIRKVSTAFSRFTSTFFLLFSRTDTWRLPMTSLRLTKRNSFAPNYFITLFFIFLIRNTNFHSSLKLYV